MKKLTAKDLAKKTAKDLVALRAKIRKELFDLKIKNSIRSLENTHLISLAKKNIARINTFVTQLRLG